MFNPTSGAPTSGPLIDNGTLVWVQISVRGIKHSRESGGAYADLEMTVAHGPCEKRKLWDLIMSPFDPKNSSGAKQMGIAAITRILECEGTFDPANPETYNLFNEPPANTFEAVLGRLDGITVGIKVKVEKGTEGYPDKNKVGEWLSPNPASGSQKLHAKLLAGETSATPQKQAFTPPGAFVPPGAGQQSTQAAQTTVMPPGSYLHPTPTNPSTPSTNGAPPPWLTRPAP